MSGTMGKKTEEIRELMEKFKAYMATATDPEVRAKANELYESVNEKLDEIKTIEE